jgi:hypothetical protein
VFYVKDNGSPRGSSMFWGPIVRVGTWVLGPESMEDPRRLPLSGTKEWAILLFIWTDWKENMAMEKWDHKLTHSNNSWTLWNIYAWQIFYLTRDLQIKRKFKITHSLWLWRHKFYGWQLFLRLLLKIGGDIMSHLNIPPKREEGSCTYSLR